MADVLSLSFFSDGRLSLSNLHADVALDYILYLTDDLDYVRESQLDWSMCLVGVRGECAPTGATDGPTGTGTRQDGWMTNLFVWHI